MYIYISQESQDCQTWGKLAGELRLPMGSQDNVHIQCIYIYMRSKVIRGTIQELIAYYR